MTAYHPSLDAARRSHQPCISLFHLISTIVLYPWHDVMVKTDISSCSIIHASWLFLHGRLVAFSLSSETYSDPNLNAV